MNSELESRWKSSLPPFSATTVNVESSEMDTCLSSNQLLKVLSIVVPHLKKKFLEPKIFLNEDWHCHDGYIKESKPITWESLEGYIQDLKTLESHQHGDSFVFWSIYDENFNFLLRFHLGDDSSFRCSFDISIADSENESAVNELRSILAPLSVFLIVSPAKQYFDRVYAG